MRRFLLVGAVLGCLLVGNGAQAVEETKSCSIAFGGHNAATCTAGNIVVDGPVSFSQTVALGPLEDHFYGDVQVSIANAAGTSWSQVMCTYRPTSLLVASCVEQSSGGDWSEDNVGICKVITSGIGEVTGSCSVEHPEG